MRSEIQQRLINLILFWLKNREDYKKMSDYELVSELATMLNYVVKELK